MELLILLIVAAYFAPTMAACIRKPANLGSIVVINLFAGWTLIGWVCALAMAFRDVRPE